MVISILLFDRPGCFSIHATLPDIQLQVHDRPSTELVNGLLAHRLDIGICLLPLSHPQLTTMPLSRAIHPRCPCCHEDRDAPRTHAGSRTPASRADAAQLLFTELVKAECAKAEVHPQVVIEISSPESILPAVAGETGATILLALT